MSRPRARLEAEIVAVLAQPVSRGPVTSSESLTDFAERVSRDRKTRQKRLHQALLRYPALVVTDRRGRRTLLIRSGEMSHPEEGAYRVTQLLEDGPLGHVTRRSILALAQELASDLAPEKIEPVGDAEVTAWVSTPAYVEGAARVLEVQRLNRR